MRDAKASQRRFGGSATLLAMVVAFVLAFLAADDRTRPLLLNTVALSGGAALLSLPVGLGLALLIHRTNMPGRRVVHAMIMLMLFLPPYLQLAGWDAAGGLQGWLGPLVSADPATGLLSGWRGAIWVQTLVNVPWIVLILGSALVSMPPELEEQASLDGRPWRVLQQVTVPLLRPAIVASQLAVFVFAASDITITDVFQIRTFAEEIYTGFALGDQLGDIPLRTLPGILLISGLALAALLACRHVTRYLSAMSASRPWRADLGNNWPILGFVTVVVLTVLVAVPLGSLLYQAGLQVITQADERVRTWSLTKAIRMVAVSPARFAHEYAWSLALAQLTSMTVLPVTILWAWWGRNIRSLRIMGWVMVLMSLSLPGPFVALLGGRLLNQSGSDWLFYLYDRTLLLPWFTLSFRLFALAYLLAEIAVRSVPTTTVDIARTEGASWLQVLRHALWPRLSLVVGWIWLVLFALCVGDLAASILAVPPGVTTLSIRIFNLVHYGVADQLAGLCLGTVLVFGVLGGLVIGFWPDQLGVRRREL